jgi:dUTP pyrophosphatase
MVIGAKKLLQLVSDKKLVENLDKRELTNPEGTGFDLRVEKLFIPTGETFLGITHRQTSELKEICSFDKSKKNQPVYPIKPQEFYLSKTMEKVNTPADMIGLILPRTTLFRMGLFMQTGFCQPGYRGDLYFAIYNTGNQVYKLEMGARYAHIIFLQIDGDLIRSYQGQWQGGRATTKEHTVGLEKQI